MKFLALICALTAPVAGAQILNLPPEYYPLVIEGDEGGMPLWHMNCMYLDWSGHGIVGPPGERSRLRFVVPENPAATAELSRLAYQGTLHRKGGRLVLELVSMTPVGGRILKQRYELDPHDCTLSMSLQFPAGTELEIWTVPERREKYPGFGVIYTNDRAVTIEDGVQEDLVEEGGPGIRDRPLAAGDWAGTRDRFVTTVVRGDLPLLLTADESTPDRPVVRIRAADPMATDLELTAYIGAIDRDDLAAADPKLRGMLYAMLWEPLRQLSFGLQWMLDRWQDLVGRAWLAILLLSLSVKLLMAPLIAIAERWQADVNRTKSLLEPELAAIRRDFKGEDAHNRTLAVYRKHGVSHFYTFKSLAGFLIQIPIFIAAFDMLGENIRLSGESFLWIEDLAGPDRLAALPFVLPFFGGHLNLLPVVMTLFTVLAARWQEEATLTHSLLRAQRLRLYAMAGVFFVLLYTFPAAMVLYWTANNFWHLVRVGWSRLRRPKAAQPMW